MNKAPRETRKPTRLVVIDTKSNLHAGFIGKESEASFIPQEPISKAFVEEFRRDPKGTLDSLENTPQELTEASTDSPWVTVGKFLEAHVKTTPITWDKLDKQSLANIEQGMFGCLMKGDYEDALIGLSYLVYQNRIHITNKAEFVLQDPTLAYQDTQPEPPESA